MSMLTFILVTIIFWFAGNSILKILFQMIQPDGALDVMFNWQRKLDDWYGKASEGSKKHRWLHDALGGCQVCTSFWFMPVWFTIYFLFCELVLHWFITDYVNSLGAKVFVGYVWFAVFWSIGAVLGLNVLRFLKRKKNV